jgi:putative DNA primase/helicase
VAGTLTTIAEIRGAVQAVVADEQAALTPPPSIGGSGPPPIDGKYIRSCLENNERGDGVLFATLFKGRFVFNKKEKDDGWYGFNGVHWEKDKRNDAHDCVEQVAALYLREADRLLGLIDTARESLAVANALIAEANATAKHAKQTKNSDLQTEADIQGKAAEAEAAKHKADLVSCKAYRKEFMRRVNRLRSVNGIEKTLTCAHRIGSDSLSVLGNEFDQRPWLLPCKNGVIDLQTGALRLGNPDDYLLHSIPYEYNPDPDYLLTGQNSPCPRWEKFISEILLDKPDIIAFLQRLLGYGITGLSTEHFLGVFIGDGRNGKGTMFETIKAILGELAWSIQPEMLLEQKNIRSSAGPSADLASLYGRRFVIASETDEGRRISGAMVKRLTGADTLTVRAPHDKYEYTFTPTHSLYLYTNDAPYGLARDFALRERLLYIDFPLRYVDDPAAKSLQDPAHAEHYRLKAAGLPAALLAEAAGIIAWLVRGCLLWQRDGLAPPASVRAAVASIGYSDDLLAQYLDACCYQDWAEDRLYPSGDIRCHEQLAYKSLRDDNLNNPPGDSPDWWSYLCPGVQSGDWLTLKELYGSFKKWYFDNIDEREIKVPGKKLVGKWLDKKGFARDIRGGTAYVYGIRLLPSAVIGA